MKEIFKKAVAVVLTAAMAMSVGMPAFAAEDESILDDLANNIVQIEVVSDDSGAIVTTYTGLDTFVEKIHNEYPEITDYDIAEFMNKYTNQYFEGMPEEELLRILNYDNISTSKQFVIINADGTSKYRMKKLYRQILGLRRMAVWKLQQVIQDMIVTKPECTMMCGLLLIG